MTGEERDIARRLIDEARRLRVEAHDADAARARRLQAACSGADGSTVTSASQMRLVEDMLAGRIARERELAAGSAA